MLCSGRIEVSNEHTKQSGICIAAIMFTAPHSESVYGKTDVLIFVHGHNKPFEGCVCFNISAGSPSLVRLFTQASVPLFRLRVEKHFSNEDLTPLLTDWLMECDEGEKQRDVSLLLSPNDNNMKLWMEAGGPEPTVKAFVKWVFLHRLEVIQHTSTSGRAGSLVVKAKTHSNQSNSHLPPQTYKQIEFKCTEKDRKDLRGHGGVGKGEDMNFYWDENGHKHTNSPSSPMEKALVTAFAHVTYYLLIHSLRSLNPI